MKKFIYKLLDIESEQASRVFSMLGMGFFMGIMLATLDVSAATLFLQNFDEKADLPTAIILSGCAGLVMTGLYNFLQSRIRYATLANFALVLITCGLIGIQYAYNFIGEVKYVYYGVFVFLVPINYLSLLIFWGTFGRIFTLRESKKIIGSIDTGQLLASIFALFSIPFALTYLKVADLFLVSLGASVGVVLMMLIITLSKFLHISGSRKTGRISYTQLVRSKYVMLMSLFVIVSMIAVSFVDYAFLNATGQQFTENNLANFLSLFEATVVIFSFLFQTFVTDRVISLYGLRIALIINPILIGIFTFLAASIGLSFGYIKESSESFIYFFIIISMGKLFIDSMKDALDGPSFKLYFLPVDSFVRFDVQTKVEGVITAFAGLLAGSLILLINEFQLSLIYITIFTLPLVAMWYLIINRMHHGYKETLQNTLVRNKQTQNISIRQEFSVNQVLENESKSDRTENILYSLKLMERLEPALFENTAVSLLKNRDTSISNYALNKVKGLNLHYDKGSEIHEIAQEALGQTEDFNVLEVSDLQLEKLGKSVQKQDRVTACRLLRTQINNKNLFLLLELLRDMDFQVRMEAINTARKVRRPETWSVLIDLTDSINYGHSSTCALIEAGEPCLQYLETAFSKSGQRDSVMLKIIIIIGRIGGPEAVNLLWKKIDYPDKRISSQVLVWLRYFNYSATRERERQTLFEILDDDIAKAIWNISAMEELPNTEAYIYLKEALNDELDMNYDHIFMLLSILYDQNSIQLVRENIETGSSEGITFALELMDIFIDKELRPKLFPLFDDIDPRDKLLQLQIYFPREEYKPWEVLNLILNRTNDQANRWTKACSLYAMAFFDDFKITKAMVAQLFNPDFMIQETAAWVIYHKENTVFQKVSKRLPEDDRKALVDSISKNQLIDGLEDGAFLRIEMVMFLKQVELMSKLKGDQLCQLIDKMKVVQLVKGEEHKIKTQSSQSTLLIVADGQVEVQLKNNDPLTLQKRDIFGEIFRLENDLHIENLTAIENSVVFTMNTNDFYDVLGSNHQLLSELINSVSKHINITIDTTVELSN